MMYQKLSKLPLLLLLMLLSTQSIAQTGVFDVRFLINSIDCENSKLFFDIQIRADAPGTEFNIAEQNYRFAFNNGLDDISLVQELDISGFMPSDGPQGFSFYNTHTLTGSMDTVVSYNIELSSGDGAFIEPTDYTSVGRLCLTIIDFNEPVCLTWLTSADFPNTFVSEIYNNMREQVEEGFYLNYKQDISSACNNTPPAATNDSGTTPEGQAIALCLPTNDSDAENALDPSSVTLLSTPPTSEGTVTIDAATGCITFTPTAGFTGTVTAFDYQICDEGIFIPAYQGDNNPYPTLPEPDPGDPDIQTQLPACASASINITVTDDDIPVSDEVPTLGEWGLIVLALMMSITAVAGIRERKKAVVSS